MGGMPHGGEQGGFPLGSAARQRQPPSTGVRGHTAPRNTGGCHCCEQSRSPRRLPADAAGKTLWPPARRQALRGALGGVRGSAKGTRAYYCPIISRGCCASWKGPSLARARAMHSRALPACPKPRRGRRVGPALRARCRRTSPKSDSSTCAPAATALYPLGPVPLAGRPDMLPASEHHLCRWAMQPAIWSPLVAPPITPRPERVRRRARAPRVHTQQTAL